jgi:neutral trehalase
LFIHIADENQTQKEPNKPMTDPSQTAQLTSGDLSGGGNIDKIREILFGSQMRDYEKRFSRLEDRLLKECANLKDETRKRLEALELFMQQEVESLSERIRTAQESNIEATKEITREANQELAQELRNTTKSLDRRVSHLDEQSTKNQREIRQQLLEQSKNLSDDIQQKYVEILSMLEQEALELRTEKTDRATLAALFTEMAMRLNHEFTLPSE